MPNIQYMYDIEVDANINTQNDRKNDTQHNITKQKPNSKKKDEPRYKTEKKQ